MNRNNLLLLLLLSCTTGMAQTAREKTTFQTAGQWKPVTDIRSDVVMVYGSNDYRDITFKNRVKSCATTVTRLIT